MRHDMIKIDMIKKGMMNTDLIKIDLIEMVFIKIQTHIEMKTDMIINDSISDDTIVADST